MPKRDKSKHRKGFGTYEYEWLSLLNGNELKVFLCLRSYNPCYPSFTDIERNTNISRKTINKCIQSLKKKGFISYKQGNSYGHNNEYTILVTQKAGPVKKETSGEITPVKKETSGEITPVNPKTSVEITPVLVEKVHSNKSNVIKSIKNNKNNINTYVKEPVKNEKVSVASRYDFIKLTWNRLVEERGRTLKRVIVMTPGRKKMIDKLSKELIKTNEEWEDYFESIYDRPFLIGKSPGNDWKCDIDFVLRYNKAVKILEGGYGSNQNNPDDRYIGGKAGADQALRILTGELSFGQE